jgi:trans-aconitate methyltransferase
MSAYYDAIMTSGYYDYDAIVDSLTRVGSTGSVLEIGAGTGLILERLVTRHPDLEIAGIDLTQAMLDIAHQRLAAFPQITLTQQNVVTMELGREFDLAFSYGGVWYFVDDEDAAMISHIRDDEQNRAGLERIADHLPTGGALLLGIQSPHHDYAKPINNGMIYSQRINPIERGFRKEYYLADEGVTVMEQTTDYRVYGHEEALELLDKCGFNQVERTGAEASLFREFRKR